MTDLSGFPQLNVLELDAVHFTPFLKQSFPQIRDRYPFLFSWVLILIRKLSTHTIRFLVKVVLVVIETVLQAPFYLIRQGRGFQNFHLISIRKYFLNEVIGRCKVVLKPGFIFIFLDDFLTVVRWERLDVSRFKRSKRENDLFRSFTFSSDNTKSMAVLCFRIKICQWLKSF